MQPSILTVEPLLPIWEALSQSCEQQVDLVGFDRDQQRFLAHRDDLSKMSAMGLETLPVECIAIPESSPMLKTERFRLKASEDYSRRLTEYFPVFFVASLYELQSLMQRFQVKAYVIGGIARDLILYREKRMIVHDVDVTIEGDALAFAAFLTENSRNFRVEDEFPEFGTAKVRYKDNLMFDFASTRQEVYPHCGALPVVVNRGVPLVDDIIRRDFTVNALAFSIHELGRVLDHCGGITDIHARQVRALHPVSFFEDPSRILRALKFCARFDFELAEETRLLLSHFLHYGRMHYKGGGDRIKQELKGFLGVPESEAKGRWTRFFLAERCERLIHMESDYEPGSEARERLIRLPELLPEIEGALSAYTDRDFRFDIYLCLFCGEMSVDTFRVIAQRLGLTRNERDFVEQFRRLKAMGPERFATLHEFSSPSEIYDLFHGVPLITVASCLVELGFSDLRQMRSVLEAFLKYKRKWEKMHLELDGNDLIDLGVPEGRWIGTMLNRLRHAKLVGQAADRLGEIRYIQDQMAIMIEQKEGEATVWRTDTESRASSEEKTDVS